MVDYLHILHQVREQNPLILQITNVVTVTDCANMTICFGASPVMSEDSEDAAELAGEANALVLNIGTINDRQMEVMRSAAAVAEKRRIPLVLDPVGAGASSVRNHAVFSLLDEFNISVIKGNSGEILALSGDSGKIYGVDSISADATDAAVSLAKEYCCVVAATGEVDKITDGKRVVSIANGVASLGKVSGTGCMLTPCCAAACSVTEDYVAGCAAAMTVFGIAGEFAKKESKGYGTFKSSLFDAVSAVSSDDFLKYAKIKGDE